MNKHVSKAAFFILVLVMAMSLIGYAAAETWYPPLYTDIGTEKVPENTTSTHKYSSHFEYWSQGASAYSQMHGGCRVVAQAKLLVEAGVAPKDTSAFNPDIFFNWTVNKGYQGSGVWENDPKGQAVIGYANEMGRECTLTKVALSGGNNAANDAVIMQYLRNGYFCYLYHGDHSAYVLRDYSLQQGTAVISDSFGDCSIHPGNQWFSQLRGYNGYGTGAYGGVTFTELYCYQFNSINGAEMTSGYSRAIPDGDYIIMSAAASDKSQMYYMDIAGSDYPAADGANVILTLCNSDYPPEFDCWTLTYSNGFYSITQKGKNMTMDVNGADLSAGANVMVGNPNPGSNQKFAIKHSNKNGYIIQAKHSGFAVSLGGSCTSNTNIIQSVVTGNDNQCWLFIPYRPSQPVEEGKYYLVDGVSGNYVAGTDGNSNVQLTEKSAAGQNNIFMLTKYTDGYYKIKHVSSGQCFDVSGGLSQVSSNVAVFTDNGSIAQRWAIQSEGGNKYSLISKCNGYPLDADGSSAFHNGTNLSTHPDNGGDNQTWYLEPTEYRVTYDANGGSGAPAVQRQDFGLYLTLSTDVPTNGSLEFIGWGTDAYDVIPDYMPGDIYQSGRDITLYAIWGTTRPAIRVTCALNGNPVTADTYVGGFDIELIGPGFHDQMTRCSSYYYVAQEGYTYSITNIEPKYGYQLANVIGGELSGTIGNGMTFIILNFVERTPRSLNVRFMVDGELRDSMEGAVTFDVSVTGNTVSVNETGCPSFSRTYDEDCSYAITNINAAMPYVFEGVVSGALSGSITGDTTVVLKLGTVFVPQAEWQELESLPDNIDPDMTEVEYKNRYQVSGRTSPGEEWTLSTEGPVQYENVGDPYMSDNPVATSETCVQVGHYYFHWCGDPNDRTHSNFERRAGQLETYHIIPANVLSEYEVTGSWPDGDRYYYTFKNLSGTWAGGQTTCPDGCPYYYMGYIYQNRSPYRVNTYVRDSEWMTERDPEAVSATVRIRLKHYTVFLDGNGGEPDTELTKVYGVDLDLSEYAPALDGYLFTGWNTAEDGTADHYEPDAVYTTNEEVTLFAEWRAADAVILPTGTKRIEAEAFMGDTTIREVVVPVSCEYIGEKAFAGCTQLKKIYIPQNTVFEDNAFADCPQVVIIRTGDQ